MAALDGAAAENAPVAGGAFPLVVYVPGSGGSALENVVLAELLASRGYVVAATPSLGTAYRTAYSMLRDLDAQARDIRFAVGQLAELGAVNPGRVVVIGWSLGGLAGMLAQMRDLRIGGVVSLDASIDGAAHADFSAAYALGRRQDDDVWTARRGALDYYRRMIDELEERLSG